MMRQTFLPGVTLAAADMTNYQQIGGGGGVGGSYFLPRHHINSMRQERRLTGLPVIFR